jgi:hypothetical protein
MPDLYGELERLEQEWREAGAENLEKQRFLIAQWQQGKWLSACAHAVRYHQDSVLERWLSNQALCNALLKAAGSPRGERMLACLYVSHSLLEGNSLPGNLPLSPAEMDDLTGYLQGKPVRSRSRVSLSVLLLRDGVGQAAQLILEHIPGKAGTLYACPEHMLFVVYDPVFEAMLEGMKRTVQSLPFGVRWHLKEMQDSRFLRGDSIQGAFAVGMHLLKTAPGDYHHIAVAATLKEDNEAFAPVGMWERKYSAAQDYRHLRLVITALCQCDENEKTKPRCLPVQNVRQAVSVITRGRKRKHFWLLSAATLFLTGTILFGLLQQGSYQVYTTPGNRVIIQYGIIPRLHVDTGGIPESTRADAIYKMKRWYFRPSVVPAEADPEVWHRYIAAVRNPWDAAAVYRYLGDMPSAMQVVEPAIHASNNFNRVPALQCLALTDPARIPEVSQSLFDLLLEDPNNEIRILAACALIELGQVPFAEVEPMLTHLLLKDPSPWIQVKAAKALTRHDSHTFRHDVLQVMAPLMTSDNDNLRADAFMVLAEIGGRHPRQAYEAAMPVFENIVLPITREQLDRTVELMMSENESEFLQLHDVFEDIILRTQTDVDTWSYMLSGRLIHFANQRIKSMGFEDGLAFLLRLMEGDDAERWFFFRKACAIAIAQITPEDKLEQVLERIRRRWREEQLIYLKIALGMTIDELQIARICSRARPTGIKFQPALVN